MSQSPAALRRWSTDILSAAGIDSAAAESIDLLAHVLGVEPGRLILVDEVSDDDAETFRGLIAQRAQRVPLQYLTGRAYFAGLELQVGPGVFIPRPETELLASWALEELAGRPGPVPVADLCSGSGALALAVAAGSPAAQVIAVERSADAADYLRRNIDAQGPAVAGRVQVLRADVLDRDRMVAALGARELIVVNPPYVPSGSPVSPEVAADPYEAVFSGQTGMDLIERLIPVLAEVLAPGGAVAVEHDDTTGPATVAAFTGDGRFTRVTAHADLAGRPRFVTAVRRD
ncbi:peptide chain release factor N(5)-glutamine methyltransferase [Gordonia sp. VNK21]|uniref:peptide chain release factor N(5)-glutamine methyltransferase n=1 Tax=Gordonia sp. VNK21 TaxID=3382483 RepID=UPI0038D3A4C5